MSEREQVPLMPEEHLEALRAVDLNVYFGSHGKREEYVPDHGPAVLGVTDEEYARAAQMTAPLSAERGDTLAYEYSDVLSSKRFLTESLLFVDRSPYIPKIDMLRVAPYDTPSDSAIHLDEQLFVEPVELSEFSQEVRRFQVLNIPEYAVLQAIAKNIPCEYADANKDELYAWRVGMKEGQRQLGRLGCLFVGESLWQDVELIYRDKKMVERLGHIASGMEVHDPKDPPHLSFIAGEDHRPGVTRLLAANEIPFTQHEITPNHARRRALRNGRALLKFFVPFVKSQLQIETEQWIDNALVAASKQD